MMNIQSELAKNKEETEELVDSDASDSEDGDVNPAIANLSNKQLMQKMYMKIVKFETVQILKIKFFLKTIEANQVEMNEKIETLEGKNKDNSDEIEANKNDINVMNEEIKQIKHHQKKNEGKIKALTVEVDRNIEDEKIKDKRMKDMEVRFRQEMDAKIKSLEDQIKMINAPKFIPPIHPSGSTLQEELN